MSNLIRELRHVNNLIHNDIIPEDYKVIRIIKKIQKEKVEIFLLFNI